MAYTSGSDTLLNASKSNTVYDNDADEIQALLATHAMTERDLLQEIELSSRHIDDFMGFVARFLEAARLGNVSWRFVEEIDGNQSGCYYGYAGNLDYADARDINARLCKILDVDTSDMTFIDAFLCFVDPGDTIENNAALRYFCSLLERFAQRAFPGYSCLG